MNEASSSFGGGDRQRFNGPNSLKMLSNCESLKNWNHVDNMKFYNLIKTFKNLNHLYSKIGYATKENIDKQKELNNQLKEQWAQIPSVTSRPLKLHILIQHAIEFQEQSGYLLGTLTEQEFESVHAKVKPLERNYAGKKNGSRSIVEQWNQPNIQAPVLRLKGTPLPLTKSTQQTKTPTLRLRGRPSSMPKTFSQTEPPTLRLRGKRSNNTETPILQSNTLQDSNNTSTSIDSVTSDDQHYFGSYRPVEYEYPIVDESLNHQTDEAAIIDCDYHCSAEDQQHFLETGNNVVCRSTDGMQSTPILTVTSQPHQYTPTIERTDQSTSVTMEFNDRLPNNVTITTNKYSMRSKSSVNGTTTYIKNTTTVEDVPYQNPNQQSTALVPSSNYNQPSRNNYSTESPRFQGIFEAAEPAAGPFDGIYSANFEKEDDKKFFNRSNFH